MAAKVVAQCAYRVACLLVAGISALHAAESRVIDLRLGFVSTFKTEQPFSTILIGDPKIIDVGVTSDRTMTLNPLAVGLTNILFLDEKGQPITGVDVLVNEAGPSRVKIHNKSLLTSYTVYRCGRYFCEYVDETTAKEPAPAPATVTHQRIDERREIIDRRQ